MFQILTYNTKTSEWTEKTTKGIQPVKRYRHTTNLGEKNLIKHPNKDSNIYHKPLHLDFDRRRIIVYGGEPQGVEVDPILTTLELVNDDFIWKDVISITITLQNVGVMLQKYFIIV